MTLMVLGLLSVACGQEDTTTDSTDAAWNRFIQQPEQMTEQTTSLALKADCDNFIAGIKDGVKKGIAYAQNSPKYCKQVKAAYFRGLTFLKKSRQIVGVKPEMFLKPKLIRQLTAFSVQLEAEIAAARLIETDPTEIKLLDQLSDTFLSAMKDYGAFVATQDTALLQRAFNTLDQTFEPLARNLIHVQCRWGF